MTRKVPTTGLTIAVPKGRILGPLSALLQRAGIDTTPLTAKDRRLVRSTADGRFTFVFLKPTDVPTYVEYGAADLGICGRDTLLEQSFDVLAPVDLRMGRCRLAVAVPRGGQIGPVPRVASKYPRTAEAYFAGKGIQAEVIRVDGSVELAPLVGLCDAIVDIVETGATLKENDLEVVETIEHISTHLIANRAAYKLRSDLILPLVATLTKAAETD